MTADLELGEVWIGWLRAAGYVATGCVGPDRTHACPAALGRACHARDGADVVVVDPASDPRAVCQGRAPTRTIVLDRDRDARDRRRFLARLPDQTGSRRRS